MVDVPDLLLVTVQEVPHPYNHIVQRFFLDGAQGPYASFGLLAPLRELGCPLLVLVVGRLGGSLRFNEVLDPRASHCGTGDQGRGAGSDDDRREA